MFALISSNRFRRTHKHKGHMKGTETLSKVPNNLQTHDNTSSNRFNYTCPINGKLNGVKNDFHKLRRSIRVISRLYSYNKSLKLKFQQVHSAYHFYLESTEILQQLFSCGP